MRGGHLLVQGIGVRHIAAPERNADGPAHHRSSSPRYNWADSTGKADPSPHCNRK